MKKLLLAANISKEPMRKFHIPFRKPMREEDWQADIGPYEQTDVLKEPDEIYAEHG